jgi:outer membrane protein assembly factor BamA
LHPFRRALPAVLLLFAPLSVLAQSTIDKIVFQNPAPYTDAELLATSGLKLGQPLDKMTLPDAAQHLMDTGLFSDAQATYTAQGTHRTVIITPQPIPLEKLLPVSFQNLVWFTPDELAQGLHAAIPLYRGYASDAGTFPDTIQTALQQLLAAKGITATLSHATIEPTSQHPALVIAFRADNPTPLLNRVGLRGIPVALKPEILHVLDRIGGKPYNEGLSGVTFEDSILAPARDAGYVTATLDHLQRTPTAEPTGVTVDISADFVAGPIYNVSTITFQPTAVYTADDFARDARLHPGDRANLSNLLTTENAIAKAYLVLGYIDAYVLAPPVTDPAASTVAYTLQVVPGEVYHLGTLNIVGLAPDVRPYFDSEWTMKPGDPYSDIAVNTFLRTHAAQPQLRPYSVGFSAVGDPATHLVELTLKFIPTGAAKY